MAIYKEGKEGTRDMIKDMNNKDLIRTVNKIRAEKADPATYGRGGTSRWVTSSEFWSGHHSDLKAELARRKAAGKVRSNAGTGGVSRSRSTGFGGLSFGVPGIGMPSVGVGLPFGKKKGKGGNIFGGW